MPVVWLGLFFASVEVMTPVEAVGTPVQAPAL